MAPAFNLSNMYVVFCVVVGLCGSRRRLGFFGTFLLSFLFTSVVMLIVLLLTGQSQRAERNRGG